ncbi:MAG TPA: acyl carrier protein [Mycobacteriales bacterium]|jgi:acyl carrier protein|nr:acyl carrier protein [Mycobacteriales bacterium]
MTEQDILTGLAEIVQEITGIAADRVTPEQSFSNDLDIDSLSMVEIATAAEDKFGVSIPDAAIDDLKTVSDAVSYIAKAGVPA